MKQTYKPKNGLVAALDIGSSKVACFIARINEEAEQFEIVGIGHQASQGIKNGTIVDLEAAQAVIRQTVHAAERMAAEHMRGYPLREVVVNVPGSHMQSHHVRIEIDILGHEVTQHDIDKALGRAQDQVLADGRELVHTIAAAFCIDGQDGITDPRGLYGDQLSVDIHVVTGDGGALRNIANCVERSHLDVAALCSAPYAAGLSSLVEDELKLGCIVIDMGGGLTSFGVFQDNALIYAGSIPIGGQHITSDIARGLTTSLTDAERLKTLYGSVMPSASDETEMIDVPPIGESLSHQPNHVQRSLLVGIIRPRVEEILELTRSHLADLGPVAAASRRVVLTGGASQLPGMRELSQQILDKQVRLGRPQYMSGLPDIVSGAAFSTVSGLLHYVVSRSHETPAQVFARAEPGSLWEKIRVWLKENW